MPCTCPQHAPDARLLGARFVGCALALLLAMASGTHAAVLGVGPGQPYARVSDAVAAAQDGDTIRIAAGTYRGKQALALITQRQLTLEGDPNGPRPVLLADGLAVEDKAIWVLRGGDITLRHLVFKGARVADGNGAGVRFETGRLQVHDCLFTDNQIGLLTSNDAQAELRIDNSEFSAAPREPGRLHHLLYVGRIASLHISGSHLHGGYLGHLLKSRARRSEIRYNLIHDDAEGRASYEVDLPNGGNAVLVGNVLGQSAHSENPVLVAYGAEGPIWPGSQLLMAHNTLISARRGGWFLRTWAQHLPAETPVVAVNNLYLGLGLFSPGSAGQFSGNWPGPLSALAAPERLDFALPPDSLWRGRASHPQGLAGEAAVPSAELSAPLGTRALVPPLHWSPGALQR